MTIANTKVNYEKLIIKRYSCRSYSKTALSESDIKAIEEIISQNLKGPFGSKVRFKLNAAVPGNSKSLKDLGTYGIIKNPAAFITGAVNTSDMALLDFGYLMEKIILELTSMDIGTCWLGGTFKKSSFTSQIELREDESIPAVISLGYIAEKETATDRMAGY
ncbi:MAG: nitroreductase family protein [Spirochaetes bacterium]|nr:nitroreductase family protein [Spirochaetota bacterium]